MTIKRIVGVKIEGELKQWQRKSELLVVGTLDGVRGNMILQYPLVHYPEGKNGSEHYLARRNDGKYYYLALEEEVQ